MIQFISVQNVTELCNLGKYLHLATKKRNEAYYFYHWPDCKHIPTYEWLMSTCLSFSLSVFLSVRPFVCRPLMVNVCAFGICLRNKNEKQCIIAE